MTYDLEINVYSRNPFWSQSVFVVVTRNRSNIRISEINFFGKIGQKGDHKAPQTTVYMKPYFIFFGELADFA
jgi:hypothetical protein